MAASASYFRHEAANQLAIQIGRLAGCEIMRQYDDRRRYLEEFFPATPKQMPEQPLFNVEDIRRSFGQVAALYFLKNFGISAKFC